MKTHFYSLLTVGCALSILSVGSAYGQDKSTSTPSEQWQIHTTKEYQTSPHNKPSYYKKPPLKPAKKNMKNSLRRKGWHTAPDPYIEEGGVYTNQPHPAVTQHGHTLHRYSNGTPNSFLTPPSTVLSPSSDRAQQQSVRIHDPLPGNVPPISLPPEK